MPILFVFIALALPSLYAQEPKERKTTEGFTTAQVVGDNYRYLIAGNKQDLARNKRAVEHYQHRFVEARKVEHARANDYQKVALLYQELAAANEAILNAIQSNQHGDLKTPMTQIPEIESKIGRITGRQIERNWLTTKEMLAYVKAGVPYRSAANHVLPYAVKCWDPAAVQRFRNGLPVNPQQRPNRR